MRYLLGIDFGGGASKATLLGTDGRIAAENTVEIATAHPCGGFSEQEPEDWYAAARENIRAVLQKSGAAPGEILGVSLDGATHTAVIMDGAFRALRPAIYWTDSRSVAECRLLREQHGALILRQALHQPDTIWTLPQLMWVRAHEPGVWAKTEHVCFCKDYVRLRLTDVFCTDFIEAQGSMLFDNEKKSWSPELCGIAGLSPDKLPPLRRPTDSAGAVTKQAAAETGLAEGTPVFCGTTDTVMEVFAAGAIRRGQMTVKLATAGRICVVTDHACPDANLVNYSHVAEGLWYPGTATKSCAASYRWYRDTFGGNYRELDRAAAEVPAGCGGLMFHPYLSGELTPYADPLLRGSFTGIQAEHTKAYFSRAVLEGVALSLLDCRKTLETLGIPHEAEATVIGGGAVSPLWRQITSDALGIRLRRTENSDSSFGSAMLAGTACGVFSSLSDALLRCAHPLPATEPNPQNTELYENIYPRYRRIHDALAPVYHAMEQE